MVIESVTTSLIVGKIRKGKFTNLENFELKGWYLFLIGFGLEVSSNILYSRGILNINQMLDFSFIYIHLLSYLLVFWGIYLNRERKSMIIVFVGTMLNFVCIMANAGHMPIDLDMLKRVGLIAKDASTAALDLSHMLASKSTRLNFLGDVIPLMRPYPLPKVISIGDLLLAAGIFGLLQEGMVN